MHRVKYFYLDAFQSSQVQATGTCNLICALKPQILLDKLSLADMRSYRQTPVCHLILLWRAPVFGLVVHSKARVWVCLPWCIPVLRLPMVWWWQIISTIPY